MSSRFPDIATFPKSFDDFTLEKCNSYRSDDLKIIAGSLGISKAGTKDALCRRIEAELKNRGTEEEESENEASDIEVEVEENLICGRTEEQLRLIIKNEKIIKDIVTNKKDWTINMILDLMRTKYKIECPGNERSKFKIIINNIIDEYNRETKEKGKHNRINSICNQFKSEMLDAIIGEGIFDDINEGNIWKPSEIYEVLEEKYGLKCDANDRKLFKEWVEYRYKEFSRPSASSSAPSSQDLICGQSKSRLLDILTTEGVFLQMVTGSKKWKPQDIEQMLKTKYGINCEGVEFKNWAKNEFIKYAEKYKQDSKDQDAEQERWNREEEERERKEREDNDSDIKESVFTTSSALRKLVEDCESHTKSKIVEILKSKDINQFEGIPLYKLKKDQLCDAIRKAGRVSTRPSSSPPKPSPSKPSSPSGAACRSRAYTVTGLIDYIKDKGWEMPPRNKRTKDLLCKYIESNSRREKKEEKKEKEEVKQPTADETDEFDIEGLDNCVKSRKLTLKKMQEYAEQFEWEDIPNYKARKDQWCDWFENKLNNARAASKKKRQDAAELARRQAAAKQAADAKQETSDELKKKADADEKQRKEDETNAKKQQQAETEAIRKQQEEDKRLQREAAEEERKMIEEEKRLQREADKIRQQQEKKEAALAAKLAAEEKKYQATSSMADEISILSSISRSDQIKQQRRIILEKFAKQYIPTIYFISFLDYTEYMNHESRVDFLNEIKIKQGDDRLQYLDNIFADGLKDAVEIEAETENEKSTHNDLYDWQTNPQSQSIIYSGFAQKLREISERKIKLNLYYIKYSGVNYRAELDKGIKKEVIRRNVYNGFFNKLKGMSEKNQHDFINNLFDDNYELQLAAGERQKCAKQNEWKTILEAESDFACPPGNVCNVDSRECLPEIERDLSKFSEVDVSFDGSTVKIYGQKNKVDDIVRKVASIAPACNILSSGTQNEILTDITCPVGMGCDLEKKKCVTITSGMASTNYNGKIISGSAAEIQAMINKMNDLSPTQPQEIDDDLDLEGLEIEESEQSKQAAAKAMKELGSMFGFDAKEVSEVKETQKETQKEMNDKIVKERKEQEERLQREQKENERKERENKQKLDQQERKAREEKQRREQNEREQKDTSDKNISQETMSYVERLSSRLRDIQSNAQPVSAKIINHMNQISEKINICAGLSS